MKIVLCFISASKSDALRCLSSRTVPNKSLRVITIISPSSAFVNKWDTVRGQPPARWCVRLCRPAPAARGKEILPPCPGEAPAPRVAG